MFACLLSASLRSTFARADTQTLVPNFRALLGIVRHARHLAAVAPPDDRAGDLEEKIDDYLAFGVQYVWVINPDTHRAYSHTPTGSNEANDGVLRAGSANIEIPLSEIFQ